MNTIRPFFAGTRTYLMIAGMALMWVLFSCANIVSPAGGPKDTTPPAELTSEPLRESVSFQGKSITIRFNEYIQAPTLQQELLISPPLVYKPVIKVQGKSLKIQWDDTLRENITYTFQFGNAIKDITEGNAISDMRFYFSTGSYLDSLSLEGKVYNAWDGKTEENQLVMLYPERVSDTMISRTLPLYITKTDKDGRYHFSKLGAGSYLLAAVSDQNNNLMYDLITEPFAFYPAPVIPRYHDTAATSDPADSVQIPTKTASSEFQLRMYTGTDSIQKVMSVVTDGTFKAVIAFRYPVEKPEVELPLPEPQSNIVYRWNRNSDTLTLWLKQAITDSLKVKVTGLRYSDSVHIVFRQAVAGARGTQKPPRVAIAMNVARGGKYSPADTPMVIFSQPLANFQNDRALLISAADTVPLIFEPIGPYPYLAYRITNPLQQDSLNKILMPAGILTGWDGSTNDSVDWAFTLQGPDQYGKLNLTAEPETDSLSYILVYLLDDRSVILEKRMVKPGSEELFFPLKPGNYRLKASMDVNLNGRWDTGDFSKRQQPEPVILMEKPIQIKAGWTEEMKWNLNFNQ